MKGNHASFKPVVEKKSTHMISVDLEAGSSRTMAPYVTNTKKLAVCFLGVFVSYFVYGLLQEKM